MGLPFSLLALAAAQGSEPPLIPAFFTGERLLEICTQQNVALCSMYVAGVTDGIFHAETGDQRTLCTGDLTNRDARKIVTDYLRDNPEVRVHAAAVAVELALKPLIGCKEEIVANSKVTDAAQNGK
jgi:hypothetical protein